MTNRLPLTRTACTSHIAHRTSHIAHRTSHIAHRTRNTEHRTRNTPPTVLFNYHRWYSSDSYCARTVASIITDHRLVGNVLNDDPYGIMLRQDYPLYEAIK